MINSSGFDLLTNKPVVLILAPGTRPDSAIDKELPTFGFHKISVELATSIFDGSKEKMSERMLTLNTVINIGRY